MRSFRLEFEAGRAAVAFITDLVDWNKVLIEYRRIAITAAPGDEAVKDRLHTQAAVVERSLTRINQDAERFLSLFASRAGIKDISEGWKALESKVSAMPVDGEFAQKAFAAHGSEFDRLYAFMRDLGDRSGATLESTPDGFYLAFPLANNTPKLAGITLRIMAYQTLNVARASLTPNDKIFYEVTEAKLKDALAGVATMLGQAARSDAGRKDRLERQLADVKTHSARLLAFTRDNFIKPHAVQVAQAQVAEATRAGIDSARALVELNARMLDEAVAKHRDSVLRETALEALVILLGVVLTIYLLAGMCLSVRESTRRLDAGAVELARGNFLHRVDMDARDERADVARRFNEMTGDLGRLVAGVKTTAEEVLQASKGLATAADQISSGSHHQSEAAQSTAASVEQVPVSVGHVAENVGDAVQVSRQASSAAAESLDAIRQHAGSSLERIQDISRAAAEQRSATQEIARNVERIASMAEQNDHSVQGTIGAARNLRRLSESLNASVATFRVAA